MGKSVLIVGCGVFGLSTAVELSSKGYEVLAIDAYPVPSPLSAAADYNKIIRTEYSDKFYSKLSLEALKLWRTDKELQTAFNECGRISILPTWHKGRIEFELKGKEVLKQLGEGSKITTFLGGKKLGEKLHMFNNNSYGDDIQFSYNPECGLGHGANSLKIMKNRAESFGTKFIFGECGEAIKIGEEGDRAYVLTKSGSKYFADQILVSSGASTPQIINLNKQVTATGLFVTHIKLTEAEFARYKGIPIIFSAEEGYYFPPDPETRIMKICCSTAETYNEVHDQFGNKTSLPRYKVHNPLDTIPERSVKDIRNILSKTLPELANHAIFNSKICWISDTGNSDFLIDKAPSFRNVYVATGDSGHGFKFLPIIGNYIVQKLEGTLDSAYSDRWAWKGEIIQKKVPWRIDRYRFNLAANADKFLEEQPSSKL